VGVWACGRVGGSAYRRGAVGAHIAWKGPILMPLDQGVLAIGYLKKTEAKEPDARVLNRKKQNQLDQRGNTFWEPIELVEERYSSADSSSTDFFGILN
jgi:hypothetical protein